MLLKHFQIVTPQLSLHEHNEAARAAKIIAVLREGKSVALVSDAGTPAISDPGFELVRAVAAAGMNIVAIPGPCAAIAALSIGALPTDRFCFEGFLPARGAARKRRLKSLESEPRTLVIYESPHRVRETLEDCMAVFGEARAAAVVREATKLHETTYRGSLRELLDQAGADADFSRGEIVLLVAGAAPSRLRWASKSEASAQLDKVLIGAAGRIAVETSGAPRRADHRRARQ